MVAGATATTNSMSAWDLASAAGPDALDAVVAVPDPDLAYNAAVVAYSGESWNRVCH